MRRDWTRDELNRMARGGYDRAYNLHARPAWDAMGDDRHALYRRFVRGVLAELERVETEHRDRWRETQRRTRRIA